MHDNNDDQGLDADTGTHVEDARGYNPEEDGVLGKVKGAFGGDDEDELDEEDDDLQDAPVIDDDDEDEELL